MRLTLKLRSYCNLPPEDVKLRSFDTFPIIIGRSNNCDYSLDDPSRYISSNHAVVTNENDQLIIQDTSANGLYYNGAAEPLGRGRSIGLSQGDTLAIGDYSLLVHIESQASSSAEQAMDDPLFDFGSAPVEQPPPPLDPFKGEEQDWTPQSSLHNDSFDDDWGITEPKKSEPSTAATDDDWPDWDIDSSPPAPEPDKKPQPPIAVPTHEQGPSSAKDDFNWFPGTSSETVQNTTAPHETTSNNERHHASVHRPHTTQNSQPSTQQNPTQLGSDSSRSALATLLKAANLRETDFANYNEEQILEHTGHLLSHMVDAMMILLQSRAEIKNAMRSDVTTLSRNDNNPLKFSVSASDALTRLLSDNNVGYMPADHAIKEAVDDLKEHQLAMLDGMKAAVRSMLLQFDPDKLSKKLEKTGGITANIPITREAKLWEMFCEQYDAIREEAVNDFGELFGSEFRKAYEKRIRQLGRSPDF